jgi:hypothetical protein
MANFSMTCTCGHTIEMEAGSREEAVTKFQSFMTQEALDEHFRERHNPSEPKPTLEQAHMMIDQVLVAA